MLMKVGLFVLLLISVSGLTAQDIDLEGEIVFVLGHYYYDIAIMSSEEIEVVTTERTTFLDYTTPQWSPDGKKIAYSDRLNLFMMDADGSNLMQLTNYEAALGRYLGSISWSPHGRSIAVKFFAGDQSDRGHSIRLIDMESLTERDITRSDYSDGVFGLSWSPDHMQIVFTSNRDGDIPDATALYVVNVETGDVKALTDISEFRRDDRYPSWSPDGAQIAFVSPSPENATWAIYLIDVDGSNLQRLTTETDTPEINEIVHCCSPIDWSPDGEQIVFTACPNPYPEGCELFTIQVDTKDVRQITDDAENIAFDPDWRRKSKED